MVPKYGMHLALPRLMAAREYFMNLRHKMRYLIIKYRHGNWYLVRYIKDVMFLLYYPL